MKKYAELSLGSRQFVDAMIDAWVWQADGLGLPYEEAKAGVIDLIERGEAIFIPYGTPGTKDCEYSLELTPKGVERAMLIAEGPSVARH